MKLEVFTLLLLWLGLTAACGISKHWSIAEHSESRKGKLNNGKNTLPPEGWGGQGMPPDEED